MLFRFKYKLFWQLLQLIFIVPCSLMIACTKKVPEPERMDPSSVKKQAVSLAKTFTSLSAPRNVKAGGACNFDLVGGIPRAEENIEFSRMKFLPYVGWAALDVGAGVVGQDVTLLLTNAAIGRFAVVAKRNQRPDVAKFFLQPMLVSSGFKIQASAANVPEGEYVLSVLIDAGDQVIECGLKTKVKLK